MFGSAVNACFSPAAMFPIAYSAVFNLHFSANRHHVTVRHSLYPSFESYINGNRTFTYLESSLGPGALLLGMQKYESADGSLDPLER